MKLLNVEWLSQIADYARGKYDCGQAVSAMIIRALGGPKIWPDTLSLKLSGRTTAMHLAGFIRDYIPNVSFAYGRADTDTYQKAVDRGLFTVSLVDYKGLNLPVHLASGNDQGPHWVLVTGYDENNIIIHDPLWTPKQREGQGGAYLRIPKNIFQKAYLNETLIVAPRSIALTTRKVVVRKPILNTGVSNGRTTSERSGSSRQRGRRRVIPRRPILGK